MIRLGVCRFFAVLAICAASILATPSSAEDVTAPALIPPEDFYSGATIETLDLSPSGRYVAYVRTEKDDKTYVVVKDLHDPAAQLVGTRVPNVLWLEWATDDRLLFASDAGLSFRVTGNRFYMGSSVQIVSVDRDLKEPVVLFKDNKKIQRENLGFGDIVGFMPGDRNQLLMPIRINRDLDLVKVDIRTSEFEVIATGTSDTFYWFVDSEGQPVFRLESNMRGTEVRVYAPETRENGKIRWKKVTSFRIQRNRKREEEAPFWPLAPGPEPSQYYVKARPDGADTYGVYLYNFATDTFEKTIFSMPGADVVTALFDPETRAYTGSVYWRDKLVLDLVDEKTKRHFDALSVYFGRDASMAPVDRSEDNSVWALYVSSPSDPGSYHIYDLNRTFSTEVGYVLSSLDRGRLRPMEVVEYAARDGMAMRGYLTLPALAEGAPPPPLVVMPHGGPAVRDYLLFDDHVQYLASRGYAVFQPNFRGSSGFGKAFESAGDRQWGRAMQTDIDDGVRALIEKGRVDAQRICIVGASYGGYAALMGVATAPDLYKCAVSSSGVSDIHEQIRFDRREEGADSEVYRYWVRLLGDPGDKTDREEMKTHSPTTLAGRITAPVFLIHGKEDDNVPFDQMELMQAALTKAGRPPKVLVFEKAGHGFYDEDRKTYLVEVERFVSSIIGAPPTPVPS
jgi:dipeptidyl aminopeptidase/acylaminoacyl peptidase